MAAAILEALREETQLLDALRLRGAATPDAAALIEPGRESLTFAALQKRIQAAARAVAAAGITREDVVALVMPDGAGLIANFLGIASVAGCAVVNPALREPEIESALADLEARAVIFAPSVSSPVADIARKRGIIVLEVSRDAACPDFVPEADGGQVALLLHTSATTGKARIVPLTHSNLRAMAANTRGILNLTATDRFLSMMPLFHLQGLLSSLAQLLAGGTVICTAGFDASAFLGWLERYRPTWYTAGPTLHNAILPLIESQPEVLERSPLRFVRSIGASLPSALREEIERALHAPVLEGYGMTEAGAITSNAPPPNRRKPGSAGRSTGSEIGIMSETGQLLAPGCEGEIVVRGAAVMSSYRNNPEANRVAFRDDWFRTGDLGRLDSDGFLFVTGRLKEIINRGGEKVLPGEIEDALRAHPAVAEVAAFGIAHATLGEEAAAAVVARPGMATSEPELRRFAAERIADFKVPRRVVFMDAIPKGPTGKPARAELAEQFQRGTDAVRDVSGAANETETGLAGIWQRILKIERAGIRDDFFELGGDSLALAQLLAEAKIDLVSEERAEFLSSPTIETLARIMTRSPIGRENTPVVALQPRGSRVPFFCIPGACENPYYFMDLAKGLGEDQPFFIVRDPRRIENRGVYSIEEQAERFGASIRSLRPEGPYLLGGHCYGGIVAFEVARQLVADGQDVALLALFEVPTPGYPKVARHWRKYFRQSAALLSALVRREGHVDWGQIRSHIDVWRSLFRRKKQALTRRALVAAGMQAVVEPREPIDIRNERAGRAYAPGKLRCNVVHFLAGDQHHSTVILDDPRLGWRDVTGPGFSVRKVPGVADAIFKPPNVGELASQLRALLDGANSTNP